MIPFIRRIKMVRLSDKEFSLRYELTQLQRDRNRLERLKERTDADLLETRQRIKAIKDELAEKPKPKKKEEDWKKTEPVLKDDDIDLNGKKISEVKIDADSLVALEDSVELEEKKPEIQQGFKNAKIRKTSELKVEVKEKKPVEKKTKEKEDEKTDSA